MSTSLSPSAESLAERYARFDTPDLEAIVDSPEGEYLPEAMEAARAELSRRAQSGEPAELLEVSAAPQSRAVIFLAIFLILAGWPLIVEGGVTLISFLVSPSWDQALWGAFLLLAGLLFTYTASAIDRGFWGHFVKVYAVFGFLKAWSPGWRLVMREVRGGDDLMDFLQGVLMIALALAVHFWRRGVERRMQERERSDSLEVFD